MTDTAPAQTDLVTFTLNGAEVQAAPGRNLVDACEDAGVYIPRFCYHPRMSAVGKCRMCIVQVDTGRGMGLQPSCMLSVSDGMAVDTESDTVKRVQDGVLEMFLANHPLDCPVCDKGGECPLQDQTMAYGPGESRFVEEKRHFEKPIPISDLVFLDRERCILCDRCTRFADEVAGDPLIHFTERGNQTQVLTFPDEPFSSYFSGNTVQICPVGALTAKPYRFKARPWDLEETESTCTTCAVGCRVVTQSSQNELVRHLGVDVGPVNQGWLCDRGRFDFEAVNSPERLSVPLVRNPGNDAELIGTDWSMALTQAADGIQGSIDLNGAGSVAVIGGARLTNEAAYAWSKLARSVIGTDHVDAQLGDGLPAELVLGVPRATIDEACAADTVLLLGPDLKEELPVLYLRLRGAAEAGTTTLVEVAATDTGMTPYAGHSVRALPGEAAATISELLDGDSPAARQLRSGSVVVVVGRPSVAERPDDVARAVGILRDRRPEVTFLTALRRGNVLGALDAGLAPGILPGRVTLEAGRSTFAEAWGDLPAQPGFDTEGILRAAAAGRIGALVLLGADPLNDFPDRDLAERGLAGAGFVVAVDTFATDSARRADVLLAATTAGEVTGTTTNIEGRLSPLTPKVTPPGTARDDWAIAAELAFRLGGDLGLDSPAAILAEMAELAPSHAGCDDALADPARAAEGVVVPLGGGASGITFEPPAAATPVPVDNYAFRLVAGRKLYDAATGTAMSPSMANLAADTTLRLHPGDVQRLGLEDGERVNVISPGASAVVPVRADDAVPRGVAGLWFHQPGFVTAELIDAAASVTVVKVETR